MKNQDELVKVKICVKESVDPMRTLGDFGDQGARKLCRQQKRRENRVSVTGNRHLSRENRVICVSRETKKHKGGKNLSSLGTPRSNFCVCRCDE